MNIKIPKLRDCVLIVIGLAVIWLFFLMMTSGDYRIPLQNGYGLARLNAGTVCLDRRDPGERIGVGVIDPTIDSYAVCGHILIGERIQPASAEYYDRKYGYFIVDMNSHKISQGLTKKVWLEELRKLGITKLPRMQAPSRPR